MPRPCSICRRLDRASVDIELADPRTANTDVARRLKIAESSVRRHRAEHLPGMLKIYGSQAVLPKLGELHAEYLRLYIAGLDALAKAQAGTLISVDDAGNEHRSVSVTSISRAISEARKTLDGITRLAADAADESERPAGMADGELSARIKQQLQAVMSRQLTHDDAPREQAPAPLPVLEAHAEGEEGGPGGLSGGGVASSPSQIPLDAVMPVSTVQGISSTVAQVISDDAASTSPSTPGHEDSPVLKVPNPRYPGSPASSSEERAAAGFPDVTITLSDLRARPDLLRALADRSTSSPEA